MSWLKYCALLSCVLLLGMGAQGGSHHLPPDFTFVTIDGRTIDYASIKDGPVVMIVGASWCPECRQEAPEAQRAYLQYKDRGVSFFGVFGGSSEKEIREFAETYQITYPLGKDNGIAEAFGVRAIPQTFFFSREGKFVKRIVGSIRYQEFASILDSLLTRK